MSGIVRKGNVMDIFSAPISKSLSSTGNEDRLVTDSDSQQARPERAQARIHLLGLNERNSSFLEQIASNSRVLIIEGISGSGKDTFQNYLKSRLRNRVVYDYSEGELLWSWKHQQIKDIFKIQIRLMRNFLKHVTTVLERDDKALFILNRFHLSTYTMYAPRITARSAIEREYNLVIRALRALPTHVFLLQLMEGEMEARSSHPERGVAWRKFQQHIFQREGFENFVKRNVGLQKAMIDTAIRQKIPFSLFRLPSTSNLDMAVHRSPGTEITATFDATFSPLVHKLSGINHPARKAV